MQHYNLSNNSFDSELDGSFLNLRGLKYLNLGHNLLKGDLPNALNVFKSMEEMLLNNNELDGFIPNSFFSYNFLKKLDLSNNKFEGQVPSFLSTLFPTLIELNLSNNKLTGCIPDVYNKLCDKNINFSGNIGVPWNGDFKKYCELPSTTITQHGLACDDGIPANGPDFISINCKCTPCTNPNVVILKKFYSDMKGEQWINKSGWDQSEFSSFCNPCQWYGIKCNDQNKIVSINLSNNNLEGCLDTSFFVFTELRKIDLSKNKISCSIPNSLNKLGFLYTLNLSSNLLTGNIPPDISKIQWIDTLNFSNNQISGEGLEEINKITFLKYFDISNNKLSTTIPPYFEQMNFLKYYNASSNDLYGCMPINFGKLCSFEFDFSNNPKLPWQGEKEKYCLGEKQIGQACDDGDDTTENDSIGIDCECRGSLILSTNNPNQIDVTLSPTIVIDNIHVKSTINKNLKFIIYNQLGQQVQHGIFENQSTSIQNFNPGIYFIKILINENQFVVKKIVKI